MTFSSERHFIITDYFPSHNQLLFRASKSDHYSNNIDIIFFGVHYIQLKTFYNGLNIQKLQHSNMQHIDQPTKINLESTSNLFIIKSANEVFFIVASFFQVYENTLEFSESSLGVLHFKGRENMVLEIK